MKKQQFTEAQIIGILKEVEAGQKVGEICRKYSVCIVGWKCRR